MAVVTIGLAQTGPVEQADRREAVADALDKLLADGADVAILPELCSVTTPYVPWRTLVGWAEPVPGPTTERWREAAQRHGSFVVGGIAELDGGRIFNSAVLVAPDGVMGVYRKLHLFGDEKTVFAPGDAGLPTFELPFGRIGLCICYDMRFVEVLRILALRGALLAAVPTAWMPGFDVVPPSGLPVQAQGAILQANLDQLFIAAADRVGEEEGIRYLGASLLIGPDGGVRAGPLDGEEPGSILADVDLADAIRARRRGELITPREDRRSDVYGLVIDDETL
jgi:N-carbamoylputrescine amidase